MEIVDVLDAVLVVVENVDVEDIVDAVLLVVDIVEELVVVSVIPSDQARPNIFMLGDEKLSSIELENPSCL